MRDTRTIETVIKYNKPLDLACLLVKKFVTFQFRFIGETFRSRFINVGGKRIGEPVQTSNLLAGILIQTSPLEI